MPVAPDARVPDASGRTRARRRIARTGHSGSSPGRTSSPRIVGAVRRSARPRRHGRRGDELADTIREIPGPVGPLEVLIDTAGRRRRAPRVVFAHPLPTQGGTMHTKVVFQGAKALARIGCVVLRFNFRGVGRSAGTWDEGRGEMDDYRAALDFMAGAVSGLEIWAAGFSFGSYIAMTAGADDDRVCALIGIAPPVDQLRLRVGQARRPSRSSSSTASSDELIPLKAVREFYARLAGAEGARRDRPRQPPVRRPGQRGRRRARGSAGGFLMHDAVIVSATRTAVGKAPNGALRTVRPDEMAAAVIAEALRRAPGLDPAEIDDVILGCAMPEAEQGLNVARIASLRAGVPVDGVGRHRQPLLLVRPAGDRLRRRAHHVRLRATRSIAGGTESMSLVPMGGNKVSPNPALVDSYPDVYLSTGLVAENHARECGITREEQDAFALRSHQRALAAIDAGRFADEITPLHVPRGVADGGSATTVRDVTFTQDEGPRRDTSAARRWPSCGRPFTPPARVTAGNSSQTSDGAAARGRHVRRVREGARAEAARPLRWHSPPRASSRSASASARCRRSARC